MIFTPDNELWFIELNGSSLQNMLSWIWKMSSLNFQKVWQPDLRTKLFIKELLIKSANIFNKCALNHQTFTINVKNQQQKKKILNKWIITREEKEIINGEISSNESVVETVIYVCRPILIDFNGVENLVTSVKGKKNHLYLQNMTKKLHGLKSLNKPKYACQLPRIQMFTLIF